MNYSVYMIKVIIAPKLFSAIFTNALSLATKQFMELATRNVSLSHFNKLIILEIK